MKNIIISKELNFIKKYKQYSEVELAEIEYGLVGIYLTFSKIIIVSIIALVLGIFKEMIIFMVLFNIIRTTAFGLHATKSWICLISSLISFILLPLFCIYIKINVLFKIIIGIISIIMICKNSPADTYKRPIVNKKRRKVLKILSTTIAIIFVVISLIINNSFISNCLIFSLILENVLISPMVYKFFKLPYNNYINYIKTHSDITYWFVLNLIKFKNK